MSPHVLRLRYREVGGHVHVRVFLAEGRPERHGTFGLCGALTFRSEEWPIAHAAFRHGGWMHTEIIPEEGETA